MSLIHGIEHYRQKHEKNSDDEVRAVGSSVAANRFRKRNLFRVAKIHKQIPHLVVGEIAEHVFRHHGRVGRDQFFNFFQRHTDSRVLSADDQPGVVLLNHESTQQASVCREHRCQPIRPVNLGTGINQIAEDVIRLLSSGSGQVRSNRSSLTKQRVALGTRTFEHQPPRVDVPGAIWSDFFSR